MKQVFNYKVADVKASKHVPNFRIQSPQRLSVKEIHEAIRQKYGTKAKDFILEMYVSFDNQENPEEAAPIEAIAPIPAIGMMSATPCTMQNPEGCEVETPAGTPIQCDEFGSFCNDLSRAIQNGALPPFCQDSALDELISQILANGNYTEDTCNAVCGEKRAQVMDVISKVLQSLPNAFMYGCGQKTDIAPQTSLFIQ